MKERDISKIRSFALVGHGHVGKTSLVDTLFYNVGVADRWGKVDDGTSFADYFEDEQERKTTMHSKVFRFDKNGCNVYVMDTPGYNDYFGEVIGAFSGVDSALVVIDAVAGIQIQTTKIMRLLKKVQKPTAIFINRLDKENANFTKTVDSIRETFGLSCVPVNIPVGSEASLKAVVSVMDEPCSDQSVKDMYDAYREMFMEAFAETDDALTEKYLEGETFSQEEISAGMQKAIHERKLIPILCGSALTNIGVNELVDFVCSDFPSPDMFEPVKSADGEQERKPSVDEPYSAQVFKLVSDPYVGQLTYLRVISGVLSSEHEVYNTTSRAKEKVNNFYTFYGKEQKNVHEVFPGEIVAVAKLKHTSINDTFADHDNPIEFPPIEFPRPTTSFAVHTKNKADEEKISNALHQMALEDPTFCIKRHKETKELIISGLGDLHINGKIKAMKHRYGVDIELSTPKVAYRESIRGKSEGHCKHKKQSGGRGQYAEVFIKMEPTERGEGFEFVNEIVGGVIPKGFIPAVEKGIVGAMAKGVVAGFPVQDFRVRLYFGSFHAVDSSEMAFKIAGSKAFKDAMVKAQPYLLEPYMDVEIIITDEFMGQVTGDLNTKRGRIMGIEGAGPGLQMIKAQAPLAEMYRFPTELRSITSGSAAFSMEFSHYEEVPAMVAKDVISVYKPDEEEEE